MSDTSSTNTLVLFLIAGGLYYIQNSSNHTTDNNNTKEVESKTNIVPYIISFIILFSLKKEIQNTISTERIYTLIAISSASYLITLNADIIQIFSSIFAVLVILPAVQEYETK